jgi:hypothetical protein
LRFVLIGWVVLYHLDLTLRVTGVLPWLTAGAGRRLPRRGRVLPPVGFALWLGYGSRPPADAAGWPALPLSALGQDLAAALPWRCWPLAVVVGLAPGGGGRIATSSGSAQTISCAALPR